MKAGLAVQVAVAEALRSQLVRGSLVLHFAVGEERAEPGTSSLLAAGFGGDLGVVTEPTSLAVAVAQRGAAFVRVTLTGHGGHGGRPQLAVNPISWIPAVLAEIQAYLDAIELEAHPLLGSPTCTPTVVRAGETQNVIPDECQLIFDRRLLPGESPGAETEAIERRLSTAFSDRDLAVSVELVGEGFEPCEINSDSLVASVLLDAAAKVRGHRQAVIGTPFASDVRNLVLQGAMDAVTFGPGSIDQAHRADEYVPLDEVSMAAEILLLACRALLG
jgi:succinyl-diaminopimelate desuccinylase